MDEFCKDIQRSIVREVHPADNKQVWVFRGATPQVPIEWSVKLGEILYNLQSALDHLVWQLVLANGQEPGRHNAFPVVKDESDWQKAPTQLKGVMPQVERMIKYLQPYTGGMGLQFNVAMFRTLQELCNIDKHRHLNWLIAKSTVVIPNIPHNRLSTNSPFQGLAYNGKIEKGKALLRFNNPEEDIRPCFRIDVHFDDEQEVAGGRLVTHILNECLKAVRGAVELLEATLN